MKSQRGRIINIASVSGLMMATRAGELLGIEGGRDRADADRRARTGQPRRDDAVAAGFIATDTDGSNSGAGGDVRFDQERNYRSAARLHPQDVADAVLLWRQSGGRFHYRPRADG